MKVVFFSLGRGGLPLCWLLLLLLCCSCLDIFVSRHAVPQSIVHLVCVFCMQSFSLITCHFDKSPKMFWLIESLWLTHKKFFFFWIREPAKQQEIKTALEVQKKGSENPPTESFVMPPQPCSGNCERRDLKCPEILCYKVLLAPNWMIARNKSYLGLAIPLSEASITLCTNLCGLGSTPGDSKLQQKASPRLSRGYEEISNKFLPRFAQPFSSIPLWWFGIAIKWN